MCNRNYNHKASWKLVNEVYGRKKARTVKLKGKNVKERLGSWYDHFSNLRGGNLSADSIDDSVKQIFQKLPIEDSPFTMDENKAVKKNINTGKAAGLDGIPPEVLKVLWFRWDSPSVCKQASYEPWQARPVVRQQPGSHTKKQ